ncbi:hypothetical protein [Actinomadura rifamycini]|uniref:hypothetical protein n=1 Tax=Actinomadura rifamycini TaxID=31962 RepID=UPI00042638D1|nr:hypothetical protein [Actinomadura rifamycini]
MTAETAPATAAELRRAARELAETAVAVREASAHATAALTGGGALAALPRAPVAAARAEHALLRAVAGPGGLGHALTGGPLGTAAARLGGMAGAGSLAIRLMVTSLRLRITAVGLTDPGLLRDPLVRRLVDAVAADRDLDSVRALYALVRDRGAVRALTAIAPVFGEVLALRALLDRNPLNDATAWLIATGAGTATADPLTGISNRAVALLDSGAGAAVRVPYPADRLRDRGSILDFLANICALGPGGRVLVQTVRGPDGTDRHVVHAPGMKLGVPDDASPCDLLGAFSSTVRDSGPYSRALARAIDDYGVPPGAEIALIGHSAGGAAVMSLAQDAGFCARRTVTHVVAVGSPVDFKRPASPDTWVASVTNQHDIIPALDGQGAGTCIDRPGWYVVDYTDPTHLFPACHSAEHYTANLADDLPEHRAEIDRRLARYHGPVTRSQVYRLFDDPAPAAPTRRTVAGRELDLPITCRSGAALTAWFTADPGPARALLGPGRPALLGGRALVVLHAFDNRDTSLGPYREAHLGIAVRSPLAVRFVDSVYSTAATTEIARELWGHAATTAPVALEPALAIGDAASLAGDLGPALPAAERGVAVRSLLGGTPLRSRIDVRGPARLHPAPRARLTVRGDHPMARRLRLLGLDGARPLLCRTSREHRSTRTEGVPA